MKKSILIILFVFLGLCCSAQDTAGLYSFVDYPISTIDIQSNEYLGVDTYVRSYMNTFVRKVDAGDAIQYYYVLKVYQVVSKEIHSSLKPVFVTMVSYEELEKINIALKELLAEEDALWGKGPSSIDYVEKKYVTADGLEIGFCVDKGKLEWFVEADYYGTINGWNLKERIINNKAFSVNNGSLLEDGFQKAQMKINGLKGQ